MLSRLQEGTVDLLLLSEDTADALHPQFPCVRIPCHIQPRTARESGLPIENLEECTAIVVLWNQAISSSVRDRVVFTLNNDFCVQ